MADDYDPQVDLEMEGSFVPQVVVNFGSQVSILPKYTCRNMGIPHLVQSIFFSKVTWSNIFRAY